MDKENSLFSKVAENQVMGEIFQVTHRVLQIPRDIYMQVLAGHEEPLSEMAAQDFVEQYMKWCGDTNGVIGMVRIGKEEEEIVLDAAIRYRINPQERPFCQSD